MTPVPFFASFGSDMKGFAGFAPSPGSPPQDPVEPTPGPAPVPEDVDMSSGSSGNEANDSGCTGRDLQGSDCDDSGRELGMQVEPPDARQRWARRRPAGGGAGGAASALGGARGLGSVTRGFASSNRDYPRCPDFEHLVSLGRLTFAGSVCPEHRRP